MFSSLWFVGVELAGCCQMNPISAKELLPMSPKMSKVQQTVKELSYPGVGLDSSLPSGNPELWELSVGKPGHEHLPAPA